ncbi:hypothetical protein [Roseobacter fucihabitans]|nr:hypothetical protein [Roseobacter litoralis]
MGAFLVKDASVKAIKSRCVAGLPAQTFSGTGHRKGKSLDFTAITIDMPNGRVAVSVGVFEAGEDVNVISNINALLNYLKSIH